MAGRTGCEPPCWANDGLLSTASLLIGVAAASADRSVLLATGAAALVAGAGSMVAIGEYSSVSSQRDELADLATEAEELRSLPGPELRELTGIYQRRGLDPALAQQVAEALTRHDALAARATSWASIPRSWPGRWKQLRCPPARSRSVRWSRSSSWS